MNSCSNLANMYVQLSMQRFHYFLSLLIALRFLFICGNRPQPAFGMGRESRSDIEMMKTPYDLNKVLQIHTLSLHVTLL